MVTCWSGPAWREGAGAAQPAWMSARALASRHFIGTHLFPSRLQGRQPSPSTGGWARAELARRQEAGDAGWGSLRQGGGHTGTHSAQTLQYHTRAVSSTSGDQASKGPVLTGSKNWRLWADKGTETQHGRVCPDGTGQRQDLDLDPSSSTFSAHFSALSHTRQADSVRDPFLLRREP